MSDLKIELLPWQQEVFTDETRFKVVAAGRRCGKSHLAATLLLVNALQVTKANSHVFYVAPTQAAARDIMWNALMDMGRSVITSAHINNLQLKLVNGATISLKGADRPDTMRGVSLKFLVIDEYGEMKKSTWEEVLRPALSDQQGGALFIGTPKGRGDFYDLYMQGKDEEVVDYTSWHFTTYDNPFIPKEEIESAKRTLSSFAFRQEYLASFDAMGSDIFKEDWVQFGEEPEYGDYYIAIDLAGFEQEGARKKKRLDNTAIVITKVCPDGSWFVEDIQFGRWTFNETVERIFNAVDDYSPVSVGIEKGIAKQAVMSPLTDMMKKYGKFFRVEELTHGNAKKIDRIVNALQGRFEHGRITLAKGDWNITLLDELFNFPSTQVHDDLIDALAYIDQLQQTSYYAVEEFDEEYEMIDPIAGY